MKALIIVDVQKDFCPGGTLAVPEGDKVVPVINTLTKKFDLVVASKDWHPESSIHFTKWPGHCVRNTEGAEFHHDLNTSKIKKIFLKGTRDKDDGYSAFEATNENLEIYLRDFDIDEVYVTGLATDFCVLQTALDATRKQFNTFVVKDAVRPVYPSNEEQVFKKMQESGIQLINSSEIV